MNYYMRLALRLISAMILFMALLAFFSMFTSCYTKKQAIEKFCKQDTARILVHDTITVSLPQDTGKFVLAIDSLQKLLAQLQSDTGANNPPARIFYDDSLITLTAKLNKQKKAIEWQLLHKKPLVREVPVKVEVKVPCNCPPKYQPGLLDKIKTLFAGFGAVCLILFPAFLWIVRLTKR